jgi:hypothetical protein
MAKREFQVRIFMQGHKPLQVLMPWELYLASLKGLEILDILRDTLGDPDLAAALDQRSEDVGESEPIVTEPWDDLLREEYLG